MTNKKREYNSKKRSTNNDSLYLLLSTKDKSLLERFVLLIIIGLFIMLNLEHLSRYIQLLRI